MPQHGPLGSQKAFPPPVSPVEDLVGSSSLTSSLPLANDFLFRSDKSPLNRINSIARELKEGREGESHAPLLRLEAGK